MSRTSVLARVYANGHPPAQLRMMRLRGVGMIQAAREDVNRLLRQWGYITQLLLFAAAAD